MPEAWEISKGDAREENQITIFLIFCEDENDEPFYFRSFEVENKLKINCIPNQKKARLNLMNTLAYCEKIGLTECVNHQYRIKEGVTENIWCVYDRDLEQRDLTDIKSHDDFNFTTAIQTAEKAGLKIAWSNDAFELWVLLHFESVPTGKRLHRDYIYDRLTEIFKVVPEVADKYRVAIQSQSFGYKAYLKRRIPFLTFVLPVIKTKTDHAMIHAAAIETTFSHQIPYHDCNPCTKVHHLVRDMITAQ